MPTARYYICGQAGSGTEADPYRPEIADDLAAMVTDYVTVEMPDGTTQDFPITPGWAASQDIEPGLPPTPLPRFMVAVSVPVLPVTRTDDMSDDDYEDAVLDAIAAAASFGEAVHAEVAYDKQKNPNGYDWFEVADDGTVTLHAA